MGYRDTQFKGSFTIEVGDEAYDVSVLFRGYVGYESHAYGSTYANEAVSQIEEIVEIEMDGDVVTLRYLHVRFGRDFIDKLVAEAQRDAEEEGF